MSEWKEYKLKDLGQLQRGRSRHRPRYAFHLYGGKYPFIQTGQIREASKYITKYEQTYSEDGLKQSKLWPKGTLCVTIAANIAELAILDFDACFPDSILGFVPDKKVSDLDFIYYTLTHFQRELKHIGEGSVQDNINLGTFEDLLFPIPPLPEQTAIASVLSSLDDKIDLLHRQNATLEKMAETLFRQWFVEEAKEEWEMGRVEDLFVLQRGYDLPFQNRVDGKYPIYASSGESGFHHDYRVKGPGVTTGRSGVLGKVYYIQDDFWPLNTSLFIKEFKNSSPLHSYFILRSIDLNSFNAGSAVPTLNRNHVHEFPIEIPPMKLIYEFDDMVTPLFKKIKSNQAQIHTLTALRDTLLPKLMSGEVRVSEQD